MNPQELRNRCRLFAITIVRFCRKLPVNWVDRTLGGQLLRAGTAVAANYRAACRGRSTKEFCAKVGVVAEEADESLLWLELLKVDAPAMTKLPEYQWLSKEADQLTAIFPASYNTARQNLKNRKRDKKTKSLNPK
jgi:four helix bundle protein